MTESSQRSDYTVQPLFYILHFYIIQHCCLEGGKLLAFEVIFKLWSQLLITWVLVLQLVHQRKVETFVKLRRWGRAQYLQWRWWCWQTNWSGQILWFNIWLRRTLVTAVLELKPSIREKDAETVRNRKESVRHSSIDRRIEVSVRSAAQAMFWPTYALHWIRNTSTSCCCFGRTTGRLMRNI